MTTFNFFLFVQCTYLLFGATHNVSKVIDFPRYNTKCSRENRENIHELFRVVSRFPLHFKLHLGNLDYFWTEHLSDIFSSYSHYFTSRSRRVVICCGAAMARRRGGVAPSSDPELRRGAHTGSFQAVTPPP